MAWHKSLSVAAKGVQDPLLGEGNRCRFQTTTVTNLTGVDEMVKFGFGDGEAARVSKSPG